MIHNMEKPSKAKAIKPAKAKVGKIKSASPVSSPKAKLPAKPNSAVATKRKRKPSTSIPTSDAKNVKLDIIEEDKKIKRNGTQKTPLTDTTNKELSLDEISEKYPVLKNADLVEKFLKVPFNNNQKGRIRQAIKLSLHGTPDNNMPDVVYGKIQAILKSSKDLTDSELRRVRILYNMLKTSLETCTSSQVKVDKPKKEKSEGDGARERVKPAKGEMDGDKKEKKDEKPQKVKGPKRYVVFLGNLPLDVDKEKIMNHFSEMNEQIKDIRIPKVREGKKNAIAYLELSNEPSYELALSKHHSMLGKRRINVLYSTQKNSKITAAEAKGKAAKLIALQKSGKLIGSVPLVKKRSHRRMKMKQARAKETSENE